MTKEILKNGIYCYTDSNHRFTLDSLILSELIKDFDNMCELCAGTGVIGLGALNRGNRIDFVETDTTAVDLLIKTVTEQKLNSVNVNRQDAREFAKENAGKYDLVVFNPPYYKIGGGKLPSNSFLAKQKFELSGTLFEFIKAAKQLLCENGRLLFSVKPERKGEALKYLEELELFTDTVYDFYYNDKKPCFLTVISANMNYVLKRQESIYLYENESKTNFYKNLYKFEDK